MTRRRRGFSLIELMIVVTIIGILSAIAIPTYMGVQKKAKRSEFKVNLEVLRLLEEKAFAERGVYVTTGPLLTSRASTDALMDPVSGLPEFRPGDPDRLSYDYSVDPIVALNGGPGFMARALGKANSRDAGYRCSVDQDNRQDPLDPPGCLH